MGKSFHYFLHHKTLSLVVYFPGWFEALRFDKDLIDQQIDRDFRIFKIGLDNRFVTFSRRSVLVKSLHYIMKKISKHSRIQFLLHFICFANLCNMAEIKFQLTLEISI